MSDTDRLMSLTEDPQEEAAVRGRRFVITQQSEAVLNRVLAAMYPEAESGEELIEKVTLGLVARRGIETFGRHHEAFALMLGAEPNNDLSEVTEYLRKNLSWPKARVVFETWWRLNEVDSFLQRDGNALIPQSELDMWAQMTPEERQALADRAKKNAIAAEPSKADSPKIPTSPSTP